MLKRQSLLFSLFVFLISYLCLAGPSNITYQGTVTTSGGSASPDGNYAMRFALWNLESGGDPGTNRLWQESYINSDAITVTNGAFSVELASITAFPSNFFRDNLYLWLEVEVDLTGTAGNSFQTYSPRVSFSAAAYTFYSYNSNKLDGYDYSDFARLNSNNNYGAINKFMAAPADTTYTSAPLQVCPTSGVDTNEPLFSVYSNSSNMVVIREPGNLTVSDVIQAGTTADPVAYNRIGDGTAEGGYVSNKDDLLINGDLEVKGYVTWATTKIRNYSMNPIDFFPRSDTYQYYCASTSLFKSSGDSNAQVWHAPVHLPDGAEVTLFSVYFYDNTDSGNMSVSLDRKYMSSITPTPMAEVATSGTPGASVMSDSSITDAIINNGSYTYCVRVVFPTADIGNMIQLRSVRIRYETTGPY